MLKVGRRGVADWASIASHIHFDGLDVSRRCGNSESWRCRHPILFGALLPVVLLMCLGI